MVTPKHVERVVWRGAWLLVILKDSKYKKEFLNHFIKIYWGNDCRIDALVKTLIANDQSSNDTNFLLEIGEVFSGQCPTCLKIKDQDKEITIDIQTETKLDPQTGIFYPENQKELTM